MVFEIGDVTPEQLAVEAKCRREEERHRLVNQQAKKVHTRVSFAPVHCGLLPMFNQSVICSTGTPSSPAQKEAGSKLTRT